MIFIKIFLVKRNEFMETIHCYFFLQNSQMRSRNTWQLWARWRNRSLTPFLLDHLWFDDWWWGERNWSFFQRIKCIWNCWESCGARDVWRWRRCGSWNCRCFCDMSRRRWRLMRLWGRTWRLNLLFDLWRVYLYWWRDARNIATSGVDRRIVCWGDWRHCGWSWNSRDCWNHFSRRKNLLLFDKQSLQCRMNVCVCHRINVIKCRKWFVMQRICRVIFLCDCW